MVDVWTEEEMDELVALSKQKLTSAQIGEKIGRTRNAVIGKICRMKGAKLFFPSMSNGSTVQRKLKKKKSVTVVPADVWAPPAEPKLPKFYDRTAPADAYTTLLPPKCKWAYGHARDWRWCPNEMMPGSAYCPEHLERSHATWKRKVTV